MINVRFFKKNAIKCTKICIYQNKVVPLHRQKQNGEADEPAATDNSGIFLSVLITNSIGTPWSSCNGSPRPHQMVFDNG